DRGFGIHRMQKSNVIDAGADVGEEVADPFAGLAILFELPFGTDNAAFVLVAASPKGFYGNRLAIERIELRLVVKCFNVAGAAIHEKKDDALGFGREVRWFGS